MDVDVQAQVDAQLSNLVNTQIEESRYALELLSSSTKDIATTRQTFSEIDQYCRKVQSDIKRTSRLGGSAFEFKVYMNR